MYKEFPELPRWLEASEVEALLRETPDHLRALVSCAVHAGLRSGELLRLRWRDIDWEAGELMVVSRGGQHTKNYESRRIPMNTALAKDLRRHPRTLSSQLRLLQSPRETVPGSPLLPEAGGYPSRDSRPRWVAPAAPRLLLTRHDAGGKTHVLYSKGTQGSQDDAALCPRVPRS